MKFSSPRARRRARLSRVERAAEARRRRALHHLERVRGRDQAALAPRPRLLAALVLAGSLAAGAFTASYALAHARVDGISVRGAARVPVAVIAAASGVERGAALAGVDPAQVAARVAQHPWVAEARALRLPSGRLLLGVTERTPAALVAVPPDGALWAVDAAGVAFAPAAGAELPALPRLVAAAAVEPGQADPDLVTGVALARALPRFRLPPGTEVHLAAPGDADGFSLQLPDLAAQVVLGREEPESRLDELVRLLGSHLPEVEHASRVDLRFRGQAVLDGDPPPAGAAQAAAPRGGEAPRKTRSAG
jgi:cell division septal protein FtsQ